MADLKRKSNSRSAGETWFTVFAMLAIIIIACSTVMAGGGLTSGPDEKSLRYYKVLLRRPESGYVFDRFCNGFLDTQTMQQLEDFLKENAEKSGKGASLLLGYYYTKNSDYDGAIKEFTKLIDSPEESDKIRISAYQHRGSANLSLLDFEAAVADYKAALALKPTDKDKLIIARQLSKAYIRSGKQKEAIALWEQIVAENPDKQELQEDLVELYIEEELFTEGLKVTDALLEKTDDSYDRVMRTLRKGDIYQFSGKDPNAIELYSETLSLVGQGTWLEREILAQISRVFMREENKTGLEKHFADLIKQYPARLSLVMKYSQILAANGKYDEAIETYKEVLKLAPGDKDVAWQFVRLLTEAKKQDEAIKAMESLVSQYTGDLELRLSLAELYNTAKKTDLAVKAVKSYLADSDKSEYAYTRAGRLLEKFKSKEDADALYNEIAKTFADSTGAQEVLAAYLNRTDRKDDAAEIWKSLAKKGELEVVLRACRTLKANKLGEEAFAVINSRFDEFKNDIVFLNNAVDIASGLKKHDQAVSWAMEMTGKAESSGQLENAVTKTKAVIKYAKKLDEVIASLEKTAQKNVQKSCLLAELYNEVGEYEKAIETLNAAGDQDDGFVLSERIRLCSQNYQWHAAAEAAEKLFASKGGANSQNAKKLVDLYRKSMQTDKAIKWVNRWKELAPGSSTPWMVHADILYADGKSTESINTLGIAVRKFDSNEDLLTRLAQNYRDTGKYADARRIYWKMYEKSESISDKLTWVEQLASIARDTGTTGTLIEQFKQRKQQDRQSVLPRLALARIYDRSEDYELRRRELIEVSRLKPDDIGIIYEIAQMEEMTGRWQDAAATLKKAKELDTTTKTDYMIARLHMEYGNEEQGIKMLLDLAGGYDAEPRQAEPLADMLIMQGYPEMAVKYLDEIIRKHRSDWRLKYLRAIAIEEQDKSEDAIDAFIALLNEDTEINLKNKGQNANPFAAQASYYEDLKRIVPARAVDFMLNFNYSYQAYMHRQNRNYYGSVGRSGRSSFIQLPASLDILKSFSVIHILNIKSFLDEDVSAGIIDRMKATGLPDAELLAELDLNNFNINYETSIMQLLEKFPDNEIPLAITSWVSQGVVDPNICRRQIDKFSDSYPILAAIAGIKLYSLSEKKDEKLLGKSFKMLEDFDKPTMMSIQLLMQHVQNYMRNPSEEDKPVQKRLSSLLVNWNDKLAAPQNQPYIGREMFQMVSALVVQSGDYEQLADLINKELTKSKKMTPAQNAQAAQAMYGNRRNLLSPLTFPPIQLPGYPDHLLQFFTGMSNNHYMRQANFDPEELLKFIDKIDDKMLKLYLYQCTEKKAEEEKLYNEMVKELAKNPALEMYSAARAFDKEQFHVAVSIIDTVRQKTSDHMQREGYDKVLVSAAVNFLSLSKEQQGKTCSDQEKAKLIELGQKAVLRLRKGKLASNQRNELSEAMRTLGLKKEADKIDKQIAAATAAGNTSSSSYSSFSSSMNRNYDRSKVDKLFSAGKKTEAMKLIMKFLEGHAKNDMMNMNSNSSHYIREPIRFLTERKLLGEMARLCKPEGTGSSRSWQVYAKVCEYLDQKDEIRNAWSKVLELKPNDAEANLYAAMYDLDDDPNNVVGYIKKIRKNKIPMMIEKVSMLANNTHSNYKQRFMAAKLAIALLKHPDIDERTDLSHTQRLLAEMENSIYVNQSNSNFSINDLYSSQQKIEPEAQKIWDERESLYKELAESLYGKPTACDVGYMNLIKLKRARKTFDPNEAVEMAMVALERYRYTPPRSSHSTYTDQQFSTTVCSVLLEKAFEDGNTEEKSEEMIAILNKNRNTNIASQLKSLSSLYTVKAEDFPDAAAKYCQFYTNQMQSKLISEYYPFKQTLLIAGKRNGIELTDYICNYLKKNNTNIQYNDLAVAAKSIQKTEGTEKVTEFVERVATVLTTTADKRKAYCQKHYNPNMGYSSGSPSLKIYNYYDFLNYLSNVGDADFIRIVFDQIKYIPTSHMERLDNITYQITNILRNGDHQKSADLIVKIGVVGDPNELVFTPMFNRNQNSLTFNSYLVSYLNRSSSYRKNFVEALNKCPDSFGKKLLLAISENNLPQVADAIAENFEAIKKLSGKKQGDLVDFIRETTGVIDGFGEKTEHAESNNWYATIARSYINKEFDDFMTKPASKILTSDVYYHNFHDLVGRIALTVLHDPNRFDKLMVRAEDLYKKGIRTRNFQKLQGSYKDTFIERFIDDSSNRKSPVIIKFYVDTARKKGCSMRQVNDYRIRQFFDDYIRDKRDSFKPGDNKKAFADLIDFAGQVFGDGNASVGLVYSMNNYLYRYHQNHEQCAALLKTLDELKIDSKFPTIVDEMIISAKLRYSSYVNEKEKKKALLDEVSKYYFDVLDNEELSEAWRFAVYDNMRSYSRDIWEKPAFTKKIMDIAIEYMQSPHGQYYPVYSSSRRFIDNYFKLEHSDEWKQKSNRFMELFFQMWTNMKSSNHTYGMDDTFIFKFLRLHCEVNGTEKPELIDYGFKMSEGNVWKIPEIYAILVNYDQQERARKGLVDNKHRWNTNSSEIIRMSPEFEAKADAFIASFENPEDMLFAKLAMWVRNDDTKEKKHEQLKLKKDDRITRLAKDYLELAKSKNEQMANGGRDVILQSLLPYKHVYPVLREHIFKLTKDQDFFALMAQDDYTLRNYYQALSTAYFNICIDEGNAKPLIDTIAKMDQYCIRNGRYRYDITSWAYSWTNPLGDKIAQNGTLSENQIDAIYQVYKSTFDAAIKLERNYRGNLSLSNIVNYYGVISMASGEMDGFLKTVNELSKDDKRDVSRYIKLDNILSRYRSSSIRKQIPPARFSKGIFEICGSESYQKELKKLGIGETLSVYALLSDRYRCDVEYMVKCLEGEKKYLKPIDQAYLQFHVGNITESVAACDEGIRLAKTDDEKINLIFNKADYSKASDPNAFEQSWQEIQPYKDKLDKRFMQKFQTVFQEKISQPDKQTEVNLEQEATQKDMLEEARNAAAANPGIWREYRKAALELFDANEPDKGLLMCDVAIAAIHDKQDLAGMLIIKAYSGKQFGRKDAVQSAWKEIQQVKDVLVDEKLIKKYNEVFAEQIKKQASKKEPQNTENELKEQEARQKAEEIINEKQVKGFVFKMIWAA